MWREGQHHIMLVKLQTGAVTMKNTEVPQKIKNRTNNTEIQLLGIYLKKIKKLIKNDMYTTYLS